VNAGGLKPNTWRKVQNLASTWEKAQAGNDAQDHQLPQPSPMSVVKSSRRARTSLTPSEVDSIRTLRATGLSVNHLAKLFGVHRGTFSQHTRA
jgi:plasmid maintenance system antidote protein VapI